MARWRWLVGEAEDFLLARRAFLALLGLCYLSAFASFAIQGRGLVTLENGQLRFSRGE